jgi:hypothetical protein
MVSELARQESDITPEIEQAVASTFDSDREQQEELEEEGLIGPDNPEGLEEDDSDDTEDSEEASAPQGEDEEGVTEDAEEDAEEETDSTEETEADESTAEVAPNHRLAARQFGWTDDQIDAFAKANPELASQTFDQLAGMFAPLSRPLSDNPLPPQPGMQAVPQQAAQEQNPSALDQLYGNLEEFADNNGEDLVEKFLKPLKEEVIEPLRQMQQASEAARQQSVANEATTAIERVTGDFREMYCTDGSRDAEQEAAVMQLALTADQLRAGADAQGRELSVSQAIEQAHLILSHGRTAEASRKQVAGKVQKRNKAITARPTKRRSPVLSGAPSEKKAAQAVQQFWVNQGDDVEL